MESGNKIMSEEPPETKYRRSALAFGSTLLAGSIFTGPAAPFVALAGVAFLAGTGLRHLLNKKARDMYNAERQERVVSKRKNLGDSSINSFYPESPETAVARRSPSQMINLLKNESERKRYNEGLEIGAGIARSYLERLSSEEHSKIYEIKIVPEQESRFLGVPFGRKSLEVKIKR